MTSLVIPPHLLPRDGRFGSGPTRVRDEQVASFTAAGSPLGTSHRKAPVKDLMGRVRTGLAQLLGVPEGYEVVLGNGGATAFWDAATFGLIRERSHHAVLGAFSQSFFTAAERAPHLQASAQRAEPGSLVVPAAQTGADAYAVVHNETSTGVTSPLVRPSGSDAGALMLVDGTSAAGAIAVDWQAVDAYYFSPQKALGSDGGLWLAVLSPAALERIEELSAARWAPAFLDLQRAVEASRKNQTLNTPAVATLMLLDEQLAWILGRGGLDWAAAHCRQASGLIYQWAEQRAWAAPFVADAAARSPVVATVDLGREAGAAVDFDAGQLSQVLRANGVVDVDAYRSLGRNQIRIGTFPSVPLEDVEALLACIDFVAEALVS